MGMIYWNPAIIAALIRKEASLIHSYYLEELSYYCEAFVIHGVYGVFSRAFQYFSRDKHKKNNENRNLSLVF
jgi:hypothetical protein